MYKNSKYNICTSAVKKIKTGCVFIFLVFSSFFTFSQYSCDTAELLCTSNTSYSYAAGTGSGNQPPGPYYDCLQTTPNATWHFIKINTSGTLDFVIESQSNGSAGQDIDFICWGPFTSPVGICNNLTAGNVVDCSYSGAYSETLNIPNGVSGQYYMVLITNYANAAQNIFFTQFSGSGSLNCNSDFICAGSTTTLSGVNPSNLTSPGYTLLPGGQTSGSGIFLVVPVVTTIYTVICTGLNSQNAVQTTSTAITVSTTPSPVISIASSAAGICSGQSATLTASGATSYTWGTGSLLPTITVSPGVTTSYMVSGSFTNMCTASAAVTVSSSATPTLTITTSNTLSCAFEPVILVVTGAASYSWSNFSSSAAFTTVNPTVTTNYTVTGFNSGQCFSSTVFQQNVQVCTGIKTLANTAGVTIYPNPNNGRFTLELAAEAHITITNLLGEKILDELKPEGKSAINLQDRANGLYILTVMQNNKPATFKLVKQ